MGVVGQEVMLAPDVSEALEKLKSELNEALSVDIAIQVDGSNHGRIEVEFASVKAATTQADSIRDRLERNGFEIIGEQKILTREL